MSALGTCVGHESQTLITPAKTPVKRGLNARTRTNQWGQDLGGRCKHTKSTPETPGRAQTLGELTGQAAAP